MQIATRSRAQSPCVVRTSALAQADSGTCPAQRDRRLVHRVTKRTQFRPRRCTPAGLPNIPAHHASNEGRNCRTNPKWPQPASCQRLKGNLPPPAARGRTKNKRKSVQIRAKPYIGSAAGTVRAGPRSFSSDAAAGPPNPHEPNSPVGHAGAVPPTRHPLCAVPDLRARPKPNAPNKPKSPPPARIRHFPPSGPKTSKQTQLHPCRPGAATPPGSPRRPRPPDRLRR